MSADAPRAEEGSLHGRTLSASLTVKDVEKSLAWYRDIVGFAVDRRHERDGTLRAVSLRAGDVRILIGQDDGKKGWDRVKGEGRHVRHRAHRHALGRAHLPTARPRRVPTDDLFGRAGLTHATRGRRAPAPGETPHPRFALTCPP